MEKYFDVIKGPLSTKVTIIIICASDDKSGYLSHQQDPFIFVGKQIVTVKFKLKRITGNKPFEQHIVSWISLKKYGDSNNVVKIGASCEQAGFSEHWTCTEESEDYSSTTKNWKEMGIIHYTSRCQDVLKYIMEVNIDVCKLQSPLVNLYNDKEFTDFHLSSGEGSVAVHKACLASHSEMFKTMFGGKWKETEECRVEPEGVTLQTLQHLKDYLYLGSLPAQGLRPLLLLAMRYLIYSLKAKCISSLASKVTQEALFDLLEFARENEIPDLTLAVVRSTPDKVVEDVSQSLMQLNVDKN